MAKDTQSEVRRQITNWKTKIYNLYQRQKVTVYPYREPLKLERKKTTTI